ELILEDQPRVVEQAPDQGRLAIIDRAAGEEAQHRLALLLRQVASDVGRNGPRCRNIMQHGQKYPSRFFFSIEPASSRSMSRPWRSEVRVLSISATTASSVSASDSTAPVSG